MQQNWEVSTYLFSPGFVTVRQGDTVNLTAFVVNGDEHEVSVADPLTCSSHAPTMAAAFLVVSR